jgi:hypothetical protein
MKYSLLFVFLLICSLGYTQLECNEEGCKFCIKNTKDHCSQNSGWKASWFQSVPQTRSIDLMQENQNKYASNETNEDFHNLTVSPDSKKEFSIEFPFSYTDDLQFKFELKHRFITRGDFNLVLVDKKNIPFTIKFSKQDSLMKVTCSDDQLFTFKFISQTSPLLFSFEKDDKGWFMKIKQKENRTETPIKFIFENSEYFEFNIDNKTLSQKIKSIQFSFDNIKKGSWTIFDLSIYNQLKNSEKDLIQNQSVHSDISIQPGKTQPDNTYTSGNKVFALFVYNEDYQNLGDLPGTTRDANKLDSALKKKIGSGFYKSKFISNLNSESFNLETLTNNDLLKVMKESDIIIVHYGGHGFSYQGENHWVPTDFTGVIKINKSLASEFDQKSDAIKIIGQQAYIKDELEKQNYTIMPIKLLNQLNGNFEDKLIILISDACRNEIALTLEDPHKKERGLIPSFKTTSEVVGKDFEDSNENKKNYLFLQYTVSASQKANDENSYTDKLANLINNEDLLFTSKGNIEKILRSVPNEKSTITKYNPKANQLFVKNFNFLIDNLKDFENNNK